MDVISLVGDESRILWSDSTGLTSLYDADSHSVMTVPNLRAPKGEVPSPSPWTALMVLLRQNKVTG